MQVLEESLELLEQRIPGTQVPEMYSKKIVMYSAWASILGGQAPQVPQTSQLLVKVQPGKDANDVHSIKFRAQKRSLYAITKSSSGTNFDQCNTEGGGQVFLPLFPWKTNPEIPNSYSL